MSCSGEFTVDILIFQPGTEIEVHFQKKRCGGGDAVRSKDLGDGKALITIEGITPESKVNAIGFGGRSHEHPRKCSSMAPSLPETVVTIFTRFARLLWVIYHI